MRLMIDEAYVRRGEMLMIVGQDGQWKHSAKAIIE